jgi:hypothetical protein
MLFTMILQDKRATCEGQISTPNRCFKEVEKEHASEDRISPTTFKQIVAELNEVFFFFASELTNNAYMSM